MAKRSGIKGVAKLRRTLRRIDPEASVGVRAALRAGADAITHDALVRVPRAEGDLAESIGARFGRDGLSVVIGPAARQVAMVGGNTRAGAPFAGGSQRVRKLTIANKDALFQFFVGYWVEHGTKGSPKRNIPPMTRQPFMGPAWDLNRQWLIDQMRGAIGTALRRAAH